MIETKKKCLVMKVCTNFKREVFKLSLCILNQIASSIIIIDSPKLSQQTMLHVGFQVNTNNQPSKNFGENHSLKLQCWEIIRPSFSFFS